MRGVDEWPRARVGAIHPAAAEYPWELFSLEFREDVGGLFITRVHASSAVKDGTDDDVCDLRKF